MVVTKTQERTSAQLSFWQRFRISELGLRILLVAIIVVGGIAYLGLTTSISTRGMQVKELTDRLDALDAQQSQLQAKADELQSMQHVQAASAGMQLVRVTGVSYATTAAGAVAVR